MYTVSQAYLTAIDTGAIQHIRGAIRFPNGTETDITDAIEGSPHIEQKAMQSDDSFAFGQMYVGSAEVIVRMEGVSSAYFTGAELTLEFGVDIPDDDPEYIPLGVWDITAEKLSVDRWRLTGLDRLNRLRKPMKQHFGGGMLYLSNEMRIAEADTGIQFAQTASEIKALSGWSRYSYGVFCFYFPDNYFEWVRQIAEMIGGFAFANREGRIEFRKFAKQPCRTIQAARRFDLKIAEVPFSVAGVRYTPAQGDIYESITGDDYGSAILCIANNVYFPEGTEYTLSWLGSFIDPIADYFEGVSWYAGTVDYYGDPALDLGDMIAVSGGTAGSTVNMMCCSISWSFRAPQTITSAGIPDSGALGSTYSGGSYGSGNVTINQGEKLSVLPFEARNTDIYPDIPREVGSITIGTSAKVEAFCNVGLVLRGKTGGGTVRTRVILDEVAQLMQPITAVGADEYDTIFAAVPITLHSGKHTVAVEVQGNAEITEANFCIWGHNIYLESPDDTFDEDYIYTIANGKATVIKYIGASVFPEVPVKLGGADTYIIAADSFTETTVKAAVIPEGVVEIK